LDRIKKFLPDNVDNIKLVLEINRVAEQYGLQVKNIKYDLAKPAIPVGSQFVAQAKAGPVKDYSDFDLEFSLQGSYGNFVNFMESLERSLRIVDIESISFSSTEALSPTGAPTDNYKYDLKIKTYWLKG
jgi:Tfp pilus assembly protein PilO